MRWPGLAVALGLAVPGLPLPASACGLFPCRLPVSLPSAGVTPPANLLRFRVLVDEPGPLLLRRSTGEPVAASIKAAGDERVFSPDEPVPAGAALALVYHCANVPAGPKVIQSFVAAAPDDPSLAAGDLTVEKRELSPAGAQERAVVVVVRYRPPHHLGVVWPMVSTPAIEGHPMAWDGADGDTDAGVPLEPTLTLTAPCADSAAALWEGECGPTNRLPPRELMLTVSSHLVGGATGAAAALSLDLRCESPPPPSSSPVPPPQSGGCAYGGARPPTVLALLLASTALRRRRSG